MQCVRCGAVQCVRACVFEVWWGRDDSHWRSRLKLSPSIHCRVWSEQRAAMLMRLLSLKYVEDLRTLGFCCIFFGVCALQYAIDTHEIGERFGFFLLTSLLAFSGAVTVHNAIHVPISRSRRVNEVFQIVLSLWYGHTASAYVPGHNLSHHRNLQTRRDIMSTYKMRYRSNFLNGFLFAPTIMVATGKNDSNYFAAQARLGRPIYRQMQTEMLVFVVFQMILASIDARRWLYVFFLPQLIGKYMIISMNTLQHDGCDEHSKYNHSRNFVDSWLNYFAFNNGYHGIHHMYPGKHWAVTKMEHYQRVHPHIHPNLEHPSLLAYLFEAFVYPGKRVAYDGGKYDLPEHGPDEEWFYETSESYSDCVRQTPSYTLMKDGETKYSEAKQKDNAEDSRKRYTSKKSKSTVRTPRRRSVGRKTK